MAATIGGRVAEQMVNGDISTGALNDLEKLTRQANAMVYTLLFACQELISYICYAKE